MNQRLLAYRRKLAEHKKRQQLAMLKHSIPKLQRLLQQYKKVKSVLDDSFYKVTRINPRRLQTPRNYQDYLEKYVNQFRYNENNNRENNNSNNNNVRRYFRG
jgi:hypothetical protein